MLTQVRLESRLLLCINSIPIRLNGVDTSNDLRGVQLSVRVTDTNVLTPAVHITPAMGNFFPSSSITSATPVSNGWDFLLTAPLSPTQAVTGTGTVITLPFTARSEGCTRLIFTDHQLSSGSAQLIPHSAGDAYLCATEQGNATGNAYLDWRHSGHYTNTQVTLIGPRGTYTTATDAQGNFAFNNITSDTYTLLASHALFVRANRTVTIVGSLTTTIPLVGLWAGDMNQDQAVDLYDWYLLSAAIQPVEDPAFDINDAGTTDIQDLIMLENNRNRPGMTTTNPPVRPGLLALSNGARNTTTANNAGSLKLVFQINGDIVLRLEGGNEPAYAIGTRLDLPPDASVAQIEPGTAFSGGFLQWHRDGNKLYVVVAPAQGRSVAQNSDVAVIRGAAFTGVSIEAENIVPARISAVFLFLPVIRK